VGIRTHRQRLLLLQILHLHLHLVSRQHQRLAQALQPQRRKRLKLRSLLNQHNQLRPRRLLHLNLHRKQLLQLTEYD
jgi:hypothetical protein